MLGALQLNVEISAECVKLGVLVFFQLSDISEYQQILDAFFFFPILYKYTFNEMLSNEV